MLKRVIGDCCILLVFSLTGRNVVKSTGAGSTFLQTVGLNLQASGLLKLQRLISLKTDLRLKV